MHTYMHAYTHTYMHTYTRTYIHQYMTVLTTEVLAYSSLLQNVFSYYRMCSLTTECVLLLQNVFSYYRMCSLTTDVFAC